MAMKIAVLWHGSDKHGRKPYVIVANSEEELAKKLTRFVRNRAISAQDALKAMKESKQDGSKLTMSDIIAFQQRTDLYEYYQERIRPNLDPEEGWHIVRAKKPYIA